jgi:type II secretory pathway pseudopilin PulG
LVELTVVLVIVSMLMTMALGAITSFLASAAYSDTKARQARVKDALIAYLGANKRLPCPDDPNTGGTTGNEDFSAANVCSVPFGVVPYTTLGLSQDTAEDAWGNLMSYQVYFTPQPATSPCGTSFDWTNRGCFGEGKKGGIWVYDGTLGGTMTPLAYDDSTVTPELNTRAVAVLLSHGPNGFGAWTRQATQNSMPPTSSCEEYLNAGRSIAAGCASLPTPTPAPTAPMTFIKGDRSTNDDVLTYFTADDLLQPLMKQGAIQPAAAKAMSDLQLIQQNVVGQILVSGHAYVSPVPNPKTWPDPLNSALTMTDPWGNPYEVQWNITGITNFGVVSGPSAAFCIYSNGPNSGTHNIYPTTTCQPSPANGEITTWMSPTALTMLFSNKGCPC